MKKGFTLVELLAVLIILGVLLAIIIPITNGVINNSKKTAYDTQIDVLLTEALKYSVDNNLGYENNLYKILEFKDLKNSGLIMELPINPYTDELLEGCIIYSWKNDLDNYEFIYDENCDPTDLNEQFKPTIDLVTNAISNNGWYNSSIDVLVETDGSNPTYCIGVNCTPDIRGDEIRLNDTGNHTVCALSYRNSVPIETVCKEFKIDNFVPIIVAKPNLDNFQEGVDLNTEDLFTSTFGLSGGSVVCNPSNISSLSEGNHTITCKAISNAGLETEVSKNITIYGSVDIALNASINPYNNWYNQAFSVGVDTNGSSYTYCIGTNCTPNLSGNINITTSGVHTVCAIATNGYVNSEKVCETYNVDNVKPILTPKQNNIQIQPGTNSNIADYFNSSFGPSGGNVICNPVNTSGLSGGSHTISCTATSNSGLTTVSSININVIEPNLMVSGSVFQSKIGNYRDTITEINFLDSFSGKYETASVKWDLSENNNEVVLGYIEEIDGKQILNIEADGDIIAHENLGGFCDINSKYAMFCYFSLVESINFNGNLDTSNVVSMEFLFRNATNLTSLDLSSFNTEQVIDMDSMFAKTTNLTSLDVSNFDTSNVSSMLIMFSEAESLINLDLSSFNTSKIRNMANMFYETNSLVSLNVSSFDTSSVTNMSGMFRGANSLLELDLSNFDTSKVTNMTQMFYNNKSLIDLGISNFNTGNVTNMSGMFYGVESLINLDVSSFDTSSVTDMLSMFNRTKSLKSLDLSNFNTGNVTRMSSMFSQTDNLTYLNINSFNTSSVTSMTYMFHSASSLESLDVSSFDTSQVTNMSYTFAFMSSLVSLNISHFNTSKVTDMSCMFWGSESLISLNLSNFNTSNVVDMGSMFNRMKKLTYLNVSSFDTSQVESMHQMFYSLQNITNIDVSNFDTRNVLGMDSMFGEAFKLTTLDLSSFVTSAETDVDFIIAGNTNLTTAYARTQADADRFNSSANKPIGVNFVVKP